MYRLAKHYGLQLTEAPVATGGNVFYGVYVFTSGRNATYTDTAFITNTIDKYIY
jgi:hypothetical protein